MNSLNKLTLMVALFLCAAKYSVGQNYDAESGAYSDYSAESDGSSERSSAEDSGFVTPLDFSPLFGDGSFGLDSAASSPVVGVFQKGSKKFPSIFDSGSSESQDFFQGQSSDKQFSPESFGFSPQFSQGLNSEPISQPNRYQGKVVEIERTKATAKSAAITRAPHQFNIQTTHEPSYKKQELDSGSRAYNAKPKNLDYLPSSSSYHGVNPNDATRGLKEENLTPYKKYSFQKQEYAPAPTYQALSSSYSGSYPYAQVASADPKVLRYKRYSGNRRKSKSRNAKERDDGYDHYPYKSRPKDFDESESYDAPDFSLYGEQSEEQKKYDYGSDDEYNTDEYDRIKSLSEKQAEEVQKNPEHCKKVEKDSMTCMVCQNPKTGGNYESCSYVSEPKNNKYAYVKEQKFDSKDDPQNKEESKTDPKEVPRKSEEIKSTIRPYIESLPKASDLKPLRGAAKYQNNERPLRRPQPSKRDNYSSYPSSPKAESSQPYASYQQEEADDYSDDDDDDDDQEETKKSKRNKDYDYSSSIPGFFTDNEEKKDVESVLAEFANKDRSACKKIFKNHMTCYQCTDKNGMKNEECMFVSESAPKSSHLAYKEVKEFNSKPHENQQGAESQVVTFKPTSADQLLASILTSTEASTEYSKFKKNQPLKKYIGLDDLSKKSTVATPQDHLALDKITSYLLTSTAASKPALVVKRHVKNYVRTSQPSIEDFIFDSQPAASSRLDQIANPSEFAGEESRGAFWAETVPRYDKRLGVTLPQFMLERSEQEIAFDDTISAGI